MQGLTKRQRQVLEFINENINDRGYPPTLREIGAFMGIRSTNGVNDHLKALERKGYLKKEDMKSRALRPVASAKPAETVSVPLVGRVAAGAPVLAQEHIEEVLGIDPSLLGRSEGVFALRVRGDSMIGAGILDGDTVFVKEQAVASPGDMVVAMIGDEATVKYYRPEGDTIQLVPANASMAPILYRKGDAAPFRILGTVVGVFRKIP